MHSPDNDKLGVIKPQTRNRDMTENKVFWWQLDVVLTETTNY